MSESKLPGERFWNYLSLEGEYTGTDTEAHFMRERAAWDAAATDDEFEKITFETWKESQK